ncbi:hypothetical protein BCAH1134_C0534 (plasmid) [Bacillus cereus AH1134]|nr:hypothetical protein BCAH1134_C0534 [Bacillus cereus AH1134]
MILHIKNLFFLTYSLQITYVQNSFYNKIKTQRFFTSMFLFSFWETINF